jgi:hypothetical protein
MALYQTTARCTYLTPWADCTATLYHAAELPCCLDVFDGLQW